MKVFKSRTFYENRGEGFSDKLIGKSSQDILCDFVNKNKNKIKVMGIGSGWGRWDNRFTLFYEIDAKCVEDVE